MTYLLYIGLAILVIWKVKTISRKVFVFFAVFSLIVLLNTILVPYKKFALLEGGQAIIMLLVPCLCISSKKFDLDTFIQNWWSFSLWNFWIVFLSALFTQLGIFDYSIFTAICVPNVFIGSFKILRGYKPGKMQYFIIGMNVLITLLYGGRMAALASMAMLGCSWFYAWKAPWKKKLVVLGVIVLLGIIILLNLSALFDIANGLLKSVGIHSRNLELLKQQIATKKLYLTDRDFIYSESIKYISEHYGLPGGFGIPLMITEGQYYYTHNFVLQCLTTFGWMGSLLLVVLMWRRYLYLKTHANNEVRMFLIYLGLCFLVIGTTGSSLWIHYLSTIFIALYFFAGKRTYHSLTKESGL